MAARLDYPVAVPPVPGAALELAPGVHWARLPVPGTLGHINVWLLEDGDAWTLVDTGMDVPAARAAWDGPLAAYLGGRPLGRIICTHHHPDHAGLAAWLAERHAAPVCMSAREYAILAAFDQPAAAAERLAGFARDGLLPAEVDVRILSGAGYRRLLSGVPRQVRTIADGEVLAIGAHRWRAFELAGHTDAQLVLHSDTAGLLIAGDQVLPRISSNIGIYPEREDPDPVASFLASFERLEALEPEPLVLPSHGEVFRGLRQRLGSLRAHHLATLERVMALVAGPLTARELSESLFRSPLDPLNRMLAVGESLANLEHLARRGRLAVVEAPGEPRRYRPVAEETPRDPV